MTEKLQQSLVNLRQISPKLNSVTDAANETVQRVEKFLNEECSIGLPAEGFISRQPLSHDEENDKSRYSYTYLCYDRVGGKFRIGVRADVEERGPEQEYLGTLEQGDVVEWASCSRSLKLEAFAKLPTLLQNIADTAIDAVKKTESTMETVKKVLAALGEKPA